MTLHVKVWMPKIISVFGQVHRGFYHHLFPRDVEEAGDNYPCQIIIKLVECIAKTFYEGDKVNLWITGHSLGEALAALFYARLLKIDFNNQDKYCQLQGAVTFAALLLVTITSLPNLLL